MENQDKNTIGNSRSNSISSGDPNLDTPTNTSTDPSPGRNTGESAPQTGQNIVNEQEQNKPVNMEEFVENSAQNTFDDNEKQINQVADPITNTTDDASDDETLSGPASTTGGVL